MLGIMIAALVFAISYVFGSAFEPSYLRMTSFLFWWYIVVGCLKGVLVGLFSLLFPLIGATAGFIAKKSGSLTGAMIGGLVGGIMSLRAFLMFVVGQGLLIFGAYFLRGGLILKGADYEWQSNSLIIGLVLLLLGLMFTPKKKK